MVDSKSSSPTTHSIWNGSKYVHGVNDIVLIYKKHYALHRRILNYNYLCSDPISMILTIAIDVDVSSTFAIQDLDPLIESL